jgi:hypothetical protein
MELEHRAVATILEHRRRLQRQLASSPSAAEVDALYRSAGLNLASDLRKLSTGRRIAADPTAVSYLRRNINLDGRLAVPVLTVHTTGDGLVIPQNESAYASAVKAAGRQDFLRQLFVHRAGHCAFTAAETISAIVMIVNRLDHGRWDDRGLAPGELNARARRLVTRTTTSAAFSSRLRASSITPRSLPEVGLISPA